MKKFLGYYLIMSAVGPQVNTWLKREFRDDPEFREKMQKSLRNMGLDDSTLPKWYVMITSELVRIIGAFLLMFGVKLVREK